ncbi:protease [Rhizobium sp. CG5]|uniref:M10 family metallopeptidase C-terminal domain-containing protein n=1 Tax=Rhizobium sp. CG5 TaxID=2726076 RepID=UPI002033758D|nr:M10 family metallopeptidase C-terminal domain-containing protein [Rhizobium sp. CG5]MCM2475684.1 protease [Rhizobium sp. CG5]
MPNITETTDALASTGTTYRLGIGQTAQGTISSAADADWFRVSLTAGQTYTFALVGTGGSGVTDAYLRLLNASGVEVTYNDDGGPGFNSSITFTVTTSGTYYLEASGLGDATGQYGLSATAGSRAHYDYMMGAGNLIREGDSWASAPSTAVTVTYSFDTSNSDQTDASGASTAFIALTAGQQTAARQSLALFSEVGNVTFTQASANTGTMRFSAYNSTTDGAGAYAYFPGGTGADDTAGDVNLNNDSISTGSIARGSYSFFAMLHEIGHAMGLSHPGDYNASAGVDITYDNDAQFTEDSHQYSVMSYFDEDNTTDSFDSYPDTLLMFDILAVQQLYGVNRNTRSGDSVYGFNANTGSVYNFETNTDPVFCIWDGRGNDTIDASEYSMAQRINLAAASFSNIGGFSGNVSIAVGASIENAKGGSGNDTVYGNSLANRLWGNGGNDKLTGYSGSDVMSGGNGNDQFFGGLGSDRVFGGNGNDRLYGGLGNDRLIGGAGADKFVFNTTLNGSTNVDTIDDFSVVSDFVVLENAIFTRAGAAGTLSSAAFRKNATGLAGDSSDRIIYETDTGNLFYDSNGTGSGGRVRIAHLDAGLSMTHQDFLII